ncbi:MAG: hypothetical protein ACOZQL_10310 [Myxococcota bacterium]
MSPLRSGALAFLAASLAACSCDPRLQPVPSFVRVEPSQLDFGRVIVGQARVQTVELINAGRAALEGTWSLVGEGFRSDDGVPSRALVGSTLLTVVCAPEHVGLFDGQVTIALAGFAPIVVPLACEGVAVPECVPSAPCRTSSWDVAAGRCVEQLVDDGVRCEVSDVCLLAPTCHAGRCEGQLRGCDDGDPCTNDSCHPVSGCEHSATVACPGAGPCRAGRCVSGQGCTLVDVDDGTPCGQLRGCALADVCVAGQCVQRRPPEGFVCAAGGPCGGEGTCVNGACEAAAPTPLVPSWGLAAPQPDGGPFEAWSDLFADRDGGLVVSSYFFTPPRLRAQSAAAVDLSQSARRCISWLGWVVCGDLPALATAPVSALEPGSGQLVWSFTGAATVIPEFSGAETQYFTARLAALSENELLALYESRTLHEGVDDRCRVFGLVVLDRHGQALRSRFLSDPIFQTCDHPHSYGVAVDARSNVYLAFTPSGVDNPATTLTGTTIFSFTAALQPRWRVHVPTLSGGELAVADGLLFQEQSREVRSTVDGAVVATLAAPFGLGVIGDGVAVGAGAAISLDTTTLGSRWASDAGTAATAPLTLARWASPWGPREIALGFSTSSGQVLLEATEVQTGARAFSCPVQLPRAPAMTALTPEGLAVMYGTVPNAAGWPVCDTCDPKYARTKSGFALIPLRGVGLSMGGWSGAWADEGHSHRERR